MDMQVVDGLTSGSPGVEPVGGMPLVDLGPEEVDEFEDVGALARRRLPPVADLPPRNQQGMNRIHRVGVPDRER